MNELYICCTYIDSAIKIADGFPLKETQEHSRTILTAPLPTQQSSQAAGRQALDMLDGSATVNTPNVPAPHRTHPYNNPVANANHLAAHNTTQHKL